MQPEPEKKGAHMVKEIRDKSGKIAGYRFTGESRVMFEVAMTEFNGRLERMESHVSDLKNDMNEVNGKLDKLTPFMIEMMETWRGLNTRTGQLEKVVDCTEATILIQPIKLGSLKERVKKAERIVLPVTIIIDFFKGSWQFWATAAAVTTAIITYIRFRGGR